MVQNLLWLWLWVTGGKQGAFFLLHSEHYIRSVKTCFTYTLQNYYICILIVTPYLTDGFLFADIKLWAVCQERDWCSVSPLVTGLTRVVNEWLAASICNGTGDRILCGQVSKWSNNTFRVHKEGRCFCYLSNLVFCDLKETEVCDFLSVQYPPACCVGAFGNCFEGNAFELTK